MLRKINLIISYQIDDKWFLIQIKLIIKGFPHKLMYFSQLINSLLILLIIDSLWHNFKHQCLFLFIIKIVILYLVVVQKALKVSSFFQQFMITLEKLYWV